MKIKKFLKKLLPNKKNKHQQLQIYGENNKILGILPNKLKCEIYGNNNKIILGKNLVGFSGNIYIGTTDSPCNDCYVKIGDNSTAYYPEIRIFEDNSYIKIGADCMLSSGIKLWCSDSHSILNMKNEVVNLGKSIEIGNHVWIGADVKIGKNTKISDNSIVGWGSIVTKKFEETNVIIAGNPAKIVKENINWNQKRPQQILNEKSK